ncbi:huntingtin-associated protein 1 [Protobothrops mucrosquamatus]|uniref:huntingtin-associated protein 1 n=1 Tax=Protobothrops mucrosquamatus TaxID=103944 RepID=UPI0010FAEE0D|nr:huntingtin-associated protein 1 [Protobothrops mucrosquamatus]
MEPERREAIFIESTRLNKAAVVQRRQHFLSFASDYDTTPLKPGDQGNKVHLFSAWPAGASKLCYIFLHNSCIVRVTPAKLDAAGPEEAEEGWSLSNSSHPPLLLSKEPATSNSTSSQFQNQHDASTLTDFCNSSNLPEVEIISLLGEQLPLYKLRADTVFGYDHKDWIQTPLVSSDAADALTFKQVDETLKYFLMCSERIEKITKTYHDIDAVTTLLEEKEHDLELAARIGQSLLKQNRSLSERNEFLDEQLELAKEEIAQLRHEISMRDDLLRMFTNSTEDSEPTSIISTPLRRVDSSLSLQQCLQYDLLHQKLKGLEEENQKLRTEATNIATETYEYEDQEQKLMLDCVEQFSDTSQQVILISEELALKTEDSIRQQEEISQLLAQIVEQQKKCRAYCSEVEQLQQQLTAAKEIQSQLRRELQDSQEKYTECQAMLHEAQEDIKDLRNRSLPNSTIHHSSPTFLPLDSLAAEIKSTMRKGMDSSGSSEYKSFRRVFETVKAVKRATKAKSGRATPLSFLPHSPKAASVACSHFNSPRNNRYGSDSPIMLEEKGHLAPEDPNDTHHRVDATSGTPGHHVLEAAIQSLSARQKNHSTEHSFFEMEREYKLRRLALEVEDFSGCLTPNGSITSIGTNYSGSSGTSLGSYSCFPDKLQIVKPMEGSVTLHHWQQLARPHLAGILDPRPGVLTKDFRQLDTDLEEVHNLNDLEEDEMDGSALASLATSTTVKAKERPTVFHSVNNLPQTPPTFTITTCCIMHPIKEVTMVTPSLYNTVVPSCGPCMGMSPSSPRRRQEKKEKELGLVTLLTKQGISAQSPGGALVSPPRVIKDPSLSSCFSSPSVSLWHYRLDSFADWASGLPPLQRKKPEKKMSPTRVNT